MATSVEIQVTHVGHDLQFATAEVAKSSADSSASAWTVLQLRPRPRSDRARSCFLLRRVRLATGGVCASEGQVSAPDPQNGLTLFEHVPVNCHEIDCVSLSFIPTGKFISSTGATSCELPSKRDTTRAGRLVVSRSTSSRSLSVHRSGRHCVGMGQLYRAGLDESILGYACFLGRRSSSRVTLLSRRGSYCLRGCVRSRNRSEDGGRRWRRPVHPVARSSG